MKSAPLCSGAPPASLLAAAVLLGCAGRPAEAPALPISPIGEAAERSLLPPDPHADARAALMRRYESRERRFREAYEPGSLWRHLRIEQADIDKGLLGVQEVIAIGRELFAIDFTPAQGLGNGLGARKSPLAGPRRAPNLRHVHYKEFGGPDGTRCLSCHHVGGEGGGGFRSDNVFLDGDGRTPASGLERNPRALVGAGLLQLLAEEMSAELRAQHDRARGTAALLEGVPLSAKGISFGKLKVDRSGKIDRSALAGVDPDLTVRPFGWKGTSASLREEVERALAQNLGVQPEGWLLDPAIRDDPMRVGDGPRTDPDGDGVRREATHGMVTALTLYLAALAPPIEQMPEDTSFMMRASEGARLFETLGCAGCHVPELPLQGTVLHVGPGRGAAGRVDLAPLLRPAIVKGRMPAVRLYSDLKRHDMGEALADRRDHRGVGRREWLTPPLWGVAASAPYLHDGRAPTVVEAIRAHDGEALASRQAYEKLSLLEAGALHLFLLTLDRPHHLEFRR